MVKNVWQILEKDKKWEKNLQREYSIANPSNSTSRPSRSRFAFKSRFSPFDFYDSRGFSVPIDANPPGCHWPGEKNLDSSESKT